MISALGTLPPAVLAEIGSDATGPGASGTNVQTAQSGKPVSKQASGPEAALQEVVVTAQKREELLSKVPIAITALNMEQLQEQGVVGVKDLTGTAPNLQIHTLGSDNFTGITIRGISNSDFTGSANPAVSTYIDGTYIGLSQGFANDLYDIDRIEVLRGPQGTLYGRNATGGNVNIITGEPGKAFAASADVSLGNYNDVQTHGMVNVPVNDALQIRFAFMTHQNTGYFNTEGTTARNYGAANDIGGRITALWTPSESFKWRLSVEDSRINGTPWANMETNVNGDPSNGLSPYRQPTAPDPEPQNELRNFAARSRMEWQLTNSWDVIYVAGYQSMNETLAWASTGEIGAPANPAWQNYSVVPATFQTHELDFNFQNSRLKNVFGASYFGQKGGPDFTAVSGISNAVGYSYVSVNPDAPQSHKDAWGVFDQATVSLTDSLRLTGGIRYSSEEQYIAPILYQFCGIIPGVTTLGMLTVDTSLYCAPDQVPSASGSWSSTTWKAALDADLSENTLAYVSVSTGFKSGGVQPGLPPPLPATYSPEHVTNYEVGTKSRLLDNTLSVRAALFYEDYSDLQVFQLVAVPQIGPQLVTTNAAKARIYGAEFEADWRLSVRDMLQGFVDYLHATYTQYDNAYDARTNQIIPSLTGSYLPNAPKGSLRLQYSHRFDLSGGWTLTPLVGVFWQSTTYLQANNIDYYRQRAYTKSNANLTFADPADHWKLIAYVENIENKPIRTTAWSDGSGLVYSDFDAPRTFGLRLAYHY